MILFVKPNSAYIDKYANTGTKT